MIAISEQSLINELPKSLDLEKAILAITDSYDVLRVPSNLVDSVVNKLLIEENVKMNQFTLGGEKKPRIYVTNEQQPSVLSEKDASFCLLMLLFDANGQAFLYHQQLLGIEDLLDENLDLIYGNRLQEFIAQVSQLGKDGSFFIATSDSILEVKDQLSQLEELIERDSGSQIEVLQPIKNGQYLKTSSVVFIPKQLAKDNRNHLVTYF